MSGNAGLLAGINRAGLPVPVVVVKDTLTLLFAKSGQTSYFGWAVPGTATSAAKWRVYRLISGTSAMWADGNKNFDNVWDNYASLAYF